MTVLGSKASTKAIASISTFVALGAAVRLLFTWFTIGPLHGILIKVSLAETFAYVLGLVFGVSSGFFTGAGIIVIADLMRGKVGFWTPSIAAIIGLLGVLGGLFGRYNRSPSKKLLGVSAILLTFLSEVLQNVWFSLVFNIPLTVALLMGAQAMIIAVIQNFLLFTALGPLMIKFLITPPTPGLEASKE